MAAAAAPTFTLLDIGKLLKMNHSSEGQCSSL
jgi:hypothetical protein